MFLLGAVGLPVERHIVGIVYYFCCFVVIDLSEVECSNNESAISNVFASHMLKCVIEKSVWDDHAACVLLSESV